MRGVVLTSLKHLLLAYCTARTFIRFVYRLQYSAIFRFSYYYILLLAAGGLISDDEIIKQVVSAFRAFVFYRFLQGIKRGRKAIDYQTVSPQTSSYPQPQLVSSQRKEEEKMSRNKSIALIAAVFMVRNLLVRYLFIT